MRRLSLRICAAIAICGWLAWSGPAHADGRPAQEILADIDKVESPSFDAKDRDDPKAIQAFINKRNEAMQRKAGLVRELYKADPGHDRLPELLTEMWRDQVMTAGPLSRAKLAEEIDEVVATTKSEKLKADGTYWKAVLAMQTSFLGMDAALPAIEAFIRLAPKDERGAGLLFQFASRTRDPEKQKALLKRAVADYPDGRYAKMAGGTLKKLEGVGKPFELEFTDAINGTQVSMKGLRGKVVVIDFWATWCGPCVAEMPNMKRLYEEYRGQGVEFIGVSLDQPKDQGGLDRLKEFVARSEIAWPQYYQGNGWESEFSSSWGINSIPAVFVIDPEGKLHSVEARGQLEKMIPELLKKKGDANAAGN
jgi:thiol-disulfide isomerase/thioredoxin